MQAECSPVELRPLGGRHWSRTRRLRAHRVAGGPGSAACLPSLCPSAPLKGIEPSLGDRQSPRITSSSQGQASPTLWNRTRTSGSSDRRADHIRQSGRWGVGKRPTSSCFTSIVKDRESTAGAVHPGPPGHTCRERRSFRGSGTGIRTPSCWSRASRPTVRPSPNECLMRSRAHVSRRGGRRTRTLVQAVYGRGRQPVACPRRSKKPPEAWPGAARTRSIDR